MAEFSGADLKEEENGQLVWSLKVDHVKVDPQTQISYLTGVQGFFQKGDSRLKLQAQHGTVDQKKKQIHLEGSIEGKSSDGITLNAKNLDYDGNTDILSAQGGFTAEQDGRVLTADSSLQTVFCRKLKPWAAPGCQKGMMLHEDPISCCIYSIPASSFPDSRRGGCSRNHRRCTDL